MTAKCSYKLFNLRRKLDREKSQLQNKLGELERVFDTNKKESTIRKNEYQQLIGFVENFKSTHSKSNLLKAEDERSLLKSNTSGAILDCYRECMGDEKYQELHSSLTKIDEIAKRLSTSQLMETESKNAPKISSNEQIITEQKPSFSKLVSATNAQQKPERQHSTSTSLPVNGDAHSSQTKSHHICHKATPSEVLININNNSKVQIREEYDAKNRKVINIVVDDKNNQISVEKSLFPAKTDGQTQPQTELKKNIPTEPKKNAKKKPIVKSYKSIEEYQKKIEEKLEKLKRH